MSTFTYTSTFAFNVYGTNFAVGSTISVSPSGFVRFISGGTNRYIYVYYTASSFSSGNIYYRDTTTNADLGPIQTYINRNYANNAPFTATNAFIVTWSNAVDTYGFSNTFQAIFITDGSYFYIIFNFGTCNTPNLKSAVQTGTNAFLNWDGSTSTSIASDYVYLTYNGGGMTTRTNACYNGQFVYSYPTQTVTCFVPNNSLPWYVIFAIVIGSILFVICCLGLVVALGAGIVFVILACCFKAKQNKKNKGAFKSNQRAELSNRPDQKQPLYTVQNV
jgi:hypothetical protein